MFLSSVGANGTNMFPPASLPSFGSRKTTQRSYVWTEGEESVVPVPSSQDTRIAAEMQENIFIVLLTFPA
jgi:hypothetical protein